MYGQLGFSFLAGRACEPQGRSSWGLRSVNIPVSKKSDCGEAPASILAQRYNLLVFLVYSKQNRLE